MSDRLNTTHEPPTEHNTNVLIIIDLVIYRIIYRIILGQVIVASDLHAMDAESQPRSKLGPKAIDQRIDTVDLDLLVIMSQVVVAVVGYSVLSGDIHDALAACVYNVEL